MMIGGRKGGLLLQRKGKVREGCADGTVVYGIYGDFLLSVPEFLDFACIL